MRTISLLVLLLLSKKPSITSAQLVERQERGFWPDIGDLFWDGLSIFRGVGDLFQDPQDSGSSEPAPPPATDTDTTSDRQISPDSPVVSPVSPPSSDTSSPVEPVYKININNDPSPLPDLGSNLPAGTPSLNEECDLTNIIDANCGKTTDQLIFTSSCAGINPKQAVSVEAKAQNQAIRETLVLVNGQNILAGRGGPGLRVSTSQICDVFFFAVPLTNKQIQDIERKPGVRSVRPNQALYTEDVPESFDPEDSDSEEIPVHTAPQSQLKARDRIILDPDAWADLRFISTPKEAFLANAYLYRSEAGQGVTIFAVGSGANVLHNEFVTETGESSLVGDRIYAVDTRGPENDYDDMGTCRASKLVGRTCGVAKKAKVMVTVVSKLLGSLLDALVQVANVLHGKLLRGEKVKGYHVMMVTLQWDNTDQEVMTYFEDLLDLLIRYFQVVVVVPAGADPYLGHGDINRWPATAERRHDIIVVGAVDIRTRKAMPWSRGGPFLSVSAPGIVRCAQNQGVSPLTRKTGTDVAAAQVAGLVAYFLSLDDVGPYLRQHIEIIPRWVKTYITTVASYQKPDDGDLAIWNLLGPWT
ncbi:hypothetical protein MMC29_000890 [Sticta canariensis]|nr:hypothetical protein [Sticta canariensis]